MMNLRDPIKPEKAGKVLSFLYRTAPGRGLLRVLSASGPSRVCGAFLDSPASKVLIRPFMTKNGIDPEEYFPGNYACFNDCFTRQIRPERRPIDEDPQTFIAPCDGLLSAYRLRDTRVIPAKQCAWSLDALLGNDALADTYHDGLCLVFRLCVHHYHRYCWVDDGQPGLRVQIPGKLHTVRPVALNATPVFIQNAREYVVLDSDHFGPVVQMEIGALLVGKIDNAPAPGRVQRGKEKGRFLYGGSTVLLLVQKDRIDLPDRVFDATKKGLEIPVCMGEGIAVSCDL